ncbi:MAG: Arc family DNA-binding protein [Pseudomonadota bacterium]
MSSMADEEQVKFVLRLSPTLHNKIKRRARTNNTSMNKEITNILNESFSRTSSDKLLKDLVVRLEKKKVI